MRGSVRRSLAYLFFIPFAGCSGDPAPSSLIPVSGLVLSLTETLPDSTGINGWNLARGPEPATRLHFQTRESSSCPDGNLVFAASGFSDREATQDPAATAGLAITGITTVGGCAEPPGPLEGALVFGRMLAGVHRVGITLASDSLELTIEVSDSVSVLSTGAPALELLSGEVARLRRDSFRFTCTDTTGFCDEMMADVLEDFDLTEFALDPGHDDPWGLTGEARYFMFPSQGELARAADRMEFNWFHSAFGESIRVEIRTWKNQVWLFEGDD